MFAVALCDLDNAGPPIDEEPNVSDPPAPVPKLRPLVAPPAFFLATTFVFFPAGLDAFFIFVVFEPFFGDFVAVDAFFFGFLCGGRMRSRTCFGSIQK